MAKNQIVCDTDVLIDYWDIGSKRHISTKHILENEVGLDNVIISAITKLELLLGAINKTEESKIRRKLLRFNTALINDDISAEAIILFENYHLSHGLAIPDSFIAATARIMQLELFTYNVKDYKFISKLRLFNINSK